MTVHELVECLFNAGDWERVGDIPDLEADIRKAVVEEASIGTILPTYAWKTGKDGHLEMTEGTEYAVEGDLAKGVRYLIVSKPAG